MGRSARHLVLHRRFQPTTRTSFTNGTCQACQVTFSGCSTEHVGLGWRCLSRLDPNPSGSLDQKANGNWSLICPILTTKCFKQVVLPHLFLPFYFFYPLLFILILLFSLQQL